jgi:acyl-coenzyme A synthetase/AMP-(fatty) acid ligase
VNLVVASPAALNALLRDVASGAARLQGPVIVAGGRLSVPLRNTLLHRLCTQVFVAYGSSEAGGISFGSAADLDLHTGNVGTVFSDVEAVIVGEDGKPLPTAAQGLLRVRTNSSAAAYITDPVATAEHFTDGWFQSGDVAQLSTAGNLTIVGRPADVFNIGGVKVSAEEVDAAVRDSDGVKDACALVVSDNGEPRLAILVAGGMEPPEVTVERVRSRVPGLPRLLLVSIEAIPRGSMGKLDRITLAARVGEAIFGSFDKPSQIRLVGTY